MNKIIIDFSKDKKEFYNFLNIYQILSKVNVSIPKIYEVYTKNKSIIMEDFGMPLSTKSIMIKIYIVIKT